MTVPVTPSRSTASGVWESPRRGRAVRGVLTAVGVTLALVPVHAMLLAFAVLAAGRYDSSGRGGPFRSCTAESTVCSGPEYWVLAGCAGIFAGTAWLAALAGTRAGGYRHLWRSRIALAAMSVVIAVGSAAGSWWLLR